MRVLVTDAIDPEGIAYLRERGLEVEEAVRASRETLEARLAEDLTADQVTEVATVVDADFARLIRL